MFAAKYVQLESARDFPLNCTLQADSSIFFKGNVHLLISSSNFQSDQHKRISPIKMWFLATVIHDMTPGEAWQARKHTQSQLLSSVIEKRFQLGGICVHKSLILTSLFSSVRGSRGNILNRLWNCLIYTDGNTRLENERRHLNTKPDFSHSSLTMLCNSSEKGTKNCFEILDASCVIAPLPRAEPTQHFNLKCVTSRREKWILKRMHSGFFRLSCWAN